ncbi:uncharacterized protein LOC129222199 [Uloborus diversus]|uniref:uncharacterized protein LOC129222199 n=1 Tax=Uloborus diversus TaxID=327109 RepID=UPI00240965C0|nr:uncharacterized protein LOC129222199 [Uloborus diversus]
MAPTPGPIPGSAGQVITEPQDASFLAGPRKSMTVSTKGLLNMPGQNNCFLNSAVQVLWHLDTFRRNFRELTGHACMAESCIFCALKELFTQFQYSQESALPPDALRHALAKTFCDQRRFQLGFMDDAAECFENILSRIHVHIANQETDDMCGNIHCIPHQKFAMTLVEQRICHSCGATSEPLPFTQMVHYVTTSALCKKTLDVREQQEMNSRFPSFGKCLRLAGEMGEIRDCPSECGAKVHVKKTLMNHPEVVSIGLVWDSECPTLQHITDVFHSIGMYLQLKDMFHYMFDLEWASKVTHQLVGVVTYYGKHYSTFFFHTKLRVWIYFDDATVREVGPSWEQVVEKCQRGRFQPLLLLFASPDGVDVPKQDHFMHCNNYSSNPSSPYVNQRQAIVKQYMMFQKSYQEAAKHEYSPARNSEIKYPYDSYMYNGYKTSDQTLPPPYISHVPNVPYNQGQVFNAQSNHNPPVYSNLQYLNTLQYHRENSDITKLNEISLPGVQQVPQNSSRNSLNPVDQNMYSVNNFEQQNCKDFDGAKDSDSAFTEEDLEASDLYISRKAVENVLNHQKRQLSLCRSYSQSSVGNRNSSSSLESFDNVQNTKMSPIKNQQIENRRDSGSWSSDRNSSSSNNSVENPFLTVVASKRLLLGLNKKSQLPIYTNANTSDHGYDSYSVSSSDSYPSVNGSPVKLDPRLTQIPEVWQPDEEPDLEHKLKLVTEDTQGPPDCDKLCAEADLLLAKSHEKEKDGDLVMAALLSDSAAARARAAMEAPYNNSRSLVSAKMKHSTCVMRSSNLYRRLKDHELDERRKQKSHTGHHSRQSSRDSTHSKHSRQGSKDSSHSKTGSKDSNPNSDDTENFGKNIEIYGTLPKKGSRKKNAGTSGSLKVKDDQVYKDFLDKQRKNTSLSNSLHETLLKNVDVNQTDVTTKVKTPVVAEKPHRKIPTDGTITKSPVKKKPEVPQRHDVEKRKSQKQLVEPSYQGLFFDGKNDVHSKDLLSPVTSPDKKQHKIKRKLMGGFMKRKNRSLPDLREDQNLANPMDPFLDDAIIRVPPTMMLPNGKSKIDGQTNSSIGNLMRGFHQPHHAFVKKDLTQRPLLRKVNPPNIQPSILTSPKSKPNNTLPSLSKKMQDTNKLELSSNTNMKPSKIPFISTFPKNDSSNLPPLAPIRQDSKCLSKVASTHKSSAIPVLTPQVPLSPIKVVNVPKEPEARSTSEIKQNSITSNDSEELPQPSNPFLAEIQAKRKQVLNKTLQKPELLKEAKNQNAQSLPNDTKELSMLPKLALHAGETSWLKELQSKQQQILKRQDSSLGFPDTANHNNQGKPQTNQQQILERQDSTLGSPDTAKYNNQSMSQTNQQQILNRQDSTLGFTDTANYSNQGTAQTNQQHILKRQDSTLGIPDNASYNSQSRPQANPQQIFKRQGSSLGFADTTSYNSQAAVKSNGSGNVQREPSSTSIVAETNWKLPSDKSSEDKESSPKNKTSSTSMKSSVKNLASRFENVLLKPKEPTTNVVCPFENTADHASSPKSDEKQSMEIKESPKCITASNFNKNSDSNTNTPSNIVLPLKSALKVRSEPKNEIVDSKFQTIISDNVGLPPPPSPSKLNFNHDMTLDSKGIDVVDSATTLQQRPVQPPDYATAMQRLERLRTSLGDHPTESETVHHINLQSSPKKRQGPKKTVTFSDEVVLVACAEYDEIDFSSNPLFERVYQQHVESGKGEIPILSNSLNRLDEPGLPVMNSSTSSPCNLCHNKQVCPPSIYCNDCDFYLSRYKPSQ